MQGVVTTAELAEELDVRPETVVRWIRERQIEADYREGRWLIPVEEAEAFAKAYLDGEEPEDELEDEAEEDEEEGDEDDE